VRESTGQESHLPEFGAGYTRTTMATNRQPGRAYYPELDGVRAMAALLVMGFHFCQAKHMAGVAILGQTGVDLFFVLSGFLITGILLIAEPGDWHEVRTFYVRRTLRIFPLYYGFLLLAVALGWKISAPYWVYLENFYLAVKVPMIGPAHFWSLAVEEQFYLLWPFLVLFLPRRLLLGAMWTVVAMAILTRLAILPTSISGFYFSPARMDGLAAGGLLAMYHQRRQLTGHRRLLLMMMVMAAVAVWAEWWIFRGKSQPLVEVTKFTLTTVFYAGAVGYLVSGGQSPFNGVLRSTPMRFVGRISYGLYVFHPVVFMAVFARLPRLGTVLQLALCLLLTLAVSVLSWYGLERQFLGLKDRLAPERAPLPKQKVLAEGA
jgi:peptidoglycan/LPS O-acetylase OafA/YrhL